MFKAMETEAVTLGKQLIERERELDEMFASKTTTKEKLQQALEAMPCRDKCGKYIFKRIWCRRKFSTRSRSASATNYAATLRPQIRVTMDTQQR